MLIMGPISTVFDLLTFAVLIVGFQAGGFISAVYDDV